MTWSGVNESISDGNLQSKPKNAVGSFKAVGPCSLGTPGKVYYLGPNSDVRAVLGYGALAEAARDYFLVGGRYLAAVPSEADVAGSVEWMAAYDNASADFNVAGSPTADWDCVVEIVKGGDFNVATARVSRDGGATWYGPFSITFGDTESIPIEILGTGLSVTWTNSGNVGDFFHAGDSWTVEAVGPSSTITALVAALNVDVKVPFEYALVAAPGDETDWAAYDTWARERLSQFHAPCRVITRARTPVFADDEVLIDENGEPIFQDAYVTNLLGESETYASEYVSVTASFAKITDKSGVTDIRSAVGLVAGLISAGPVQESVGRTTTKRISVVSEVYPSDEVQQQTLDTGRFVVLRRHVGLEGVYVNNGNTLAASISDFKTIERCRVMDEAIRRLRVTALKFVHSDVNVVDGVADPGGLAHMESECQLTIDLMRGEGAFSKGTITIPKDQDILTNESIDATISIVPKGYMKAINLTFQLARL